MDSHKFDRIAKTLATGGTPDTSAYRFDTIVGSLATAAPRRRLLKGALVAGGAGLLALLGAPAAEAAPCPANRQKCGPVCCPKSFVCIPREQRCAPPGQA